MHEVPDCNHSRDDLVIDEPDFKIPHPLMEERDFVMPGMPKMPGM